MNQARLHLLCGKAASGKSTLAAELTRQHNALLLSEDQLLGSLFGEEMTSLQDYVRYSGKLKDAFKPLILQLLAQGMTVVLDFPANTVDQRRWLHGLVEASGCAHTLHYLDLSNEDCKARLTVRNQQGDHPFTMTEQQFEALTRHFVPPSSSEGFEITLHRA